jgi:hypothetical protein
MYVPNNRVSEYLRQELIELQRKIDESTIIFGEFKGSLSEMDRSSRQKTSKNKVVLNNAINQLDIMDTYRLLHLVTAKYLFF